jgi:opacity protein-like surface antigen
MKKLLLTTTVAMLAAPAIAADLPSRAAPPPPAPIAAPSAARTVTVLPTFTWSGFYAGVQGGYAFGAGDGQLTETTSAATPVISSFDRSIKPRGFLKDVSRLRQTARADRTVGGGDALGKFGRKRIHACELI